MRTRILLAMGLAALVTACHRAPTAPTQAQGGASPPPQQTTPTVVSLSISAPSTIAPGETAQLTATASLSNGSIANYADKVAWRSNNQAVLTITPGGQATGHAGGEVQVSASPIGGGRVVFANVTVIPAGTFRLSGMARESGLAVSAATVAVISGQGTGLSTLTDSGGYYRLYGVAGPIEIRVSKSGYDSIVRGLTVSTSEVLDIPDLRQAGGIRSLAGAYALTLTAEGDCPALPAGAGSRTFAAAIGQDGGVLHVLLSGADFAYERNQFSGRVTPQGVTFFLSDDDYYSYLDEMNVIERFGPATLLTFLGTVDATIAPDRIAGSFRGAFAFVVQGPFGPQPSGGCSGTHLFMLTPLAGSMTRRF